jgi:enoyl-CoA hydratase/carnithine racemase
MGSSPLLLGLTQYDHALLLSSQGEPIHAEQAIKLGLITEIVPEPEKRCHEIIEQLATRSPDALAAIKRVNQASFHYNRRQVLAKETWSQIRLLLSKNTRIAMHNATKDEAKPYKQRGKW